MNLIVNVALIFISVSHLAASSNWQGRPDDSQPAWYRSPHHMAIRDEAYYPPNRAGFNHRNRPERRPNRPPPQERFSIDDLAAAMSGLERYIQQRQPFKVESQPVKEDTVFENVDEAVIDFDGPEIDQFHSNSSLNENPSEDVPAPVTDIHQKDNIVENKLNVSDCQSYGPSEFCLHLSNYPTDEIKTLLATENGSLLTLFFADGAVETTTEQPQRSPHPSTIETGVLTRFKPAATPAAAPAAAPSVAETMSLCASKSERIFPKTALTSSNRETLVIVNQDNISQPITVETCRSPNGACDFADSFPAGFKAICTQKYVTHHLAALRDNKIVREAFTFPSCCVCEVKQPVFDRNSLAAMSSRMARSASTPSRAGNGRQSQ